MRATLLLAVALSVSLPATIAAPSPNHQPRAWESRNVGRNAAMLQPPRTNAERFRAGLPPLPPKMKKTAIVSFIADHAATTKSANLD